jgi:hypothetical protein
MHDNWQIIVRVAAEHGIRLPPPTVITDFRAILAKTHITPDKEARKQGRFTTKTRRREGFTKKKARHLNVCDLCDHGE